MQLSSFESLQALVNSLNKTERDQVLRRAIIKSNHHGESPHISLFQLMLKEQASPEERVYNIWRRRQLGKATEHIFDNAKFTLRTFILETLRCNEMPGHDAYLQQRLDFANILSQKGLLEEAYKTLEISAREPIDFADPLYACILNFKMTELMPFAGKKEKSGEAIKGLLADTRKRLEEMLVFTDIFDFNIRVGQLARQTAVIKTEKDIQQASVLLEHPAAALDIKKLPFLSAITLLKSLSWLHRLLYNFKKAMQSQERLTMLMREKETHYMQFRPQQYLAEWADYCNAALKNGVLKKAEGALKQYVQTCERYGIHELNNRLMINNYSLLIALEKKETDDCCAVAEEQLDLLKKHAGRIQAGNFSALLLTLMKYFLRGRAYTKVQDCYALLMKEQAGARSDVFFIAEIIYIISIYEQLLEKAKGGTIPQSRHFKTLADSLQRRLSAVKEDLPVEKHTATLIHSLAASTEMEKHKTAFEKYTCNLQSIPDSYRYKEQLYGLFDLRMWGKGISRFQR